MTAVTNSSEAAAQTAVEIAAKVLSLPTVRSQAGPLADAAARDGATHRAFLAELLAAEVDARQTRRRERRIKEARFPRIKTLSALDFDAAPTIPAATIAALADGGWIDRGEPVVLLGDSGTGKTHLLIALGIAACEHGRSVRYLTAAQLVNELVEAADDRQLSRTVARYGRLDLLLLDELGYLQLDTRGAELLFQVLTEREERASVAVASNAPFSEWTATFTDPRLAAAVVDRLTFNAHIIQTGTDSYRLRSARAKTTTKGTTTTNT
jgi:DNA replication protein DnaC